MRKAKKFLYQSINSLLSPINVLILILCVTSSCKAPVSSSSSNDTKIQTELRDIEKRDHQLCMSQGVDFEKWADVSAEIYWRCRYNLIQDKMISNPASPEDVENSAMISEISDKILKNLQKARNAVLAGVEGNPEKSDHDKCLQMGYSLDRKNQDKNIAYYECRKKMIDDRHTPPPGIVSDYPPILLPNNNKYVAKIAQHALPPSGDVEFTINKMEKYPNCMNVNVKSKLFNQCVAAQKESLFCLENMRTVNARKQLEDKIYCQRQSLIQFPDNYTLTRNKSAKEIEEMLKQEREDEIAEEKIRKEKELNRTKKFFNEGYTSRDRLFSDENDQKNIKIRQKEKENMFNKIQILELREEFITKCNQLLEKKLPDIIEIEKRRCINIGKGWYNVEE